MKPFLPRHDDPFDVALVRSAEHDEPPPGAMKKTAAVLGLGANFAASTSGATAGASSAATGTAAIGVGVIGKYVVIGGACAFASLGAARYLKPSSATSDLTIQRVVPQPSEPVDRKAPPFVLPGPPFDREPEPKASFAEELEAPKGSDHTDILPRRRETAPRTAEARHSLKPPVEMAPPNDGAAKERAEMPAAPSSSQVPSPPAPVGERSYSLTEEVAALDRARFALAHGNPEMALGELDDHQRRFSSGVLRPEATVLRVEVLLALGRSGAASDIARAFIAAHPGSRHAARLESLLAPRRD